MRIQKYDGDDGLFYSQPSRLDRWFKNDEYDVICIELKWSELHFGY